MISANTSSNTSTSSQINSLSIVDNSADDIQPNLQNSKKIRLTQAQGGFENKNFLVSFYNKLVPTYNISNDYSICSMGKLTNPTRKSLAHNMISSKDKSIMVSVNNTRQSLSYPFISPVKYFLSLDLKAKIARAKLGEISYDCINDLTRSSYNAPNFACIRGKYNSLALSIIAKDGEITVNTLEKKIIGIFHLGSALAYCADGILNIVGLYKVLIDVKKHSVFVISKGFSDNFRAPEILKQNKTKTLDYAVDITKDGIMLRIGQKSHRKSNENFGNLDNVEEVNLSEKTLAEIDKSSRYVCAVEELLK